MAWMWFLPRQCPQSNCGLSCPAIGRRIRLVVETAAASAWSALALLGGVSERDGRSHPLPKAVRHTYAWARTGSRANPVFSHAMVLPHCETGSLARSARLTSRRYLYLRR